jgi:hypothetical protein
MGLWILNFSRNLHGSKKKKEEPQKRGQNPEIERNGTKSSSKFL